MTPRLIIRVKTAPGADEVRSEIVRELAESLPLHASSPVLPSVSLIRLIEKRARRESAYEIADFERQDRPYSEFNYSENTGIYFEVAWDFVRRGILAPTVEFSGQSSEGRFNATTFRLTSRGLLWLDDLGENLGNVTPAHGDRFRELLTSPAEKLGRAYRRWARESFDCYESTNFLASCAMCGAATEAMLIAIATARTGDEAQILNESRRGIDRIIERVIRGQNSYIRAEIDGCRQLIAYWRNDSAHPVDPDLGEVHAYTALTTLLRLADLVVKRWDEVAAPLTFTQPTPST